MRLDLALINEQIEDLHITILTNDDTSWQFVLGDGGDTEISDLIWGVSKMVQNGGCIKQRHRYLVVDYKNTKIYTLENDAEVIKLYMSLVPEKQHKLQLFY